MILITEVLFLGVVKIFDSGLTNNINLIDPPYRTSGNIISRRSEMTGETMQ